MNICVFSTTYFPNTGGAERFIHSISSKLSEKGENVYVLAPVGKEIIEEIKSPYKVIGIRFLGPFRRVKALLETALFLNLLFYHIKIGFDVIQAVVLYEPGYVATLFGLIFKIPVVVRPTGEDIQFESSSNYGKIKNKFYRKKVIKTLERADAIVSISPTIGRSVRRALPSISNDKLVPIPNGVTLSHFKKSFQKAVRREFGIPQKVKILLSIGRVVPKKDYPTMIKAFGEVCRKFDDIVLVIVGGNEGALAPLIRRLGIEKKVFLVGSLPREGQRNFKKYPPKEVLDFYNSSYMFLFSSLVEGCPNVILESMAAGLPAVAADSPGTRDFVEDGKTGLLFKPGDYKQMAEKILLLLKDKHLYEAIVEEQKRRVNEYTLDKVADRYIQLYNDLVLK